MGQSIGSATSGHGLTGAHVTAALRVTAAQQLQRHHERQAVADNNLPQGVRRTLSGIRQGAASVGEAAYSAKSTLEVEVKVGDATTTVEVSEYAPDVFRFIRQADGIQEEHFANEWSLPEERLGMELGEGRSQALFLKSKNMEFMCKTIAEDEVHVLLGILKDYTRHLANEPNSFLMRFYMLLRIQEGQEVGFIACFGDVFGSATTLNEKWDIKGRVPKPGKYRHFPHLVRSAYESDPYLIKTPCDEDLSPSATQRSSAVTSKAGGGGSSDAAVVVVKAKDKEVIPTHKDKDLTRLFWLQSETRNKLVAQLISDFTFLGTVGLMDYSLLIGVTYNEGKVSRRGKRYVVIKNMKMTHELGCDELNAVEKRPCCGSSSSFADPQNEDDEQQQQSQRLSEFARGIHSLFDQEVYHVGIIDMLTAYGAKKKIANFCKSFLWEQNTLSTIPPHKYQRRITKYTEIIFPEVR